MTGLTFSSIVVANNTSCHQGGDLVRNDGMTMHCALPPEPEQGLCETSSAQYISAMTGGRNERNHYRGLGRRTSELMILRFAHLWPIMIIISKFPIQPLLLHTFSLIAEKNGGATYFAGGSLHESGTAE